MKTLLTSTTLFEVENDDIYLMEVEDIINNFYAKEEYGQYTIKGDNWKKIIVGDSSVIFDILDSYNGKNGNEFYIEDGLFTIYLYGNSDSDFIKVTFEPVKPVEDSLLKILESYLVEYYHYDLQDNDLEVEDIDITTLLENKSAIIEMLKDDLLEMEDTTTNEYKAVKSYINRLENL